MSTVIMFMLKCFSVAHLKTESLSELQRHHSCTAKFSGMMFILLWLKFDSVDSNLHEKENASN